MSNPQVSALVQQLVGLPIWFVNCGGAAGSSFSLALGGKVVRGSPLKNPSVSQDFRQHTGEANLYVWCSWRLVAGDALASSDQEPAQFQAILKSLTGSVVQSAAVFDRCHDLDLVTDAGRLQVFCDRLPKVTSPAAASRPSAMSHPMNWELTLPTATLTIGPGFSVEVEGPSQP